MDAVYQQYHSENNIILGVEIQFDKLVNKLGNKNFVIISS